MIIFYLFVGLLIIPVLFLFFRRDNVVAIEDLKDEMETSTSSYFDFHKLRCHYTDVGSGEVIVLIHGLGDSFRIFDEFVEELRPNYRVIRFDLPGFGLSGVPNSSQIDNELIDYYASCFNAFIQEMDLEKFHLMGNSIGGWVSWHWASQHNDKLQTLTLLASAGFEMDRVKKNITQGILEHLPKFLLDKGMPVSVAKFNLQSCIYNKSKIKTQHIRNNYRMINKRGTLRFMFSLLESQAQPRLDQLAAITCPTLIVWGDRDRIIPVSHAQMFNDAMSNSELVIYSKCGHYPQIEFNKELLKDWANFRSKALT
ncbi:MAG: pimeloyl-ACP methyl ester carboxylesterase [Chitinophagales bacterium]|jgi:pimeloyl-ACP methyl ester carboxylesterase